MRIAVVGAGGLGGLLGATLHRAGHDVHLVGRGVHLQALADRGLEVVESGTSHTLRIPCSDGDALDGPVDIAFVTVKAYSVAGAAPLAARLAGAGAWIVPLVNGVDATERLIAEGVAPERLAVGVAYLTGFRVRPGVVERVGAHQRLVFGELAALPDGRHPLKAAFSDTDVHVDVCSDIRVELWRKMAVVCALAAMCGATGQPIGAARAMASGSRLQRGTVDEVLSVARGRGVPMGQDERIGIHATLDSFSEDFFPSLLHDLRQDQRTEVDALNATVSAMGAEIGIETPFNDAATDAIRTAERRHGVEP